ncbi:hypothetical protein ACN28S_32255 [Cystobacter fuscus]
MKTLPPAKENAEAKALVDRLVSNLEPAAEAFCYLEKYLALPTFVYEPGEQPDFEREGVHLVMGDLEVPEAVLNDLENRQFIFVAGNLRCRELWTSGWIFVSGALRANRVVGQSGCNNMLVCDTLEVRELVERGHSSGASRRGGPGRLEQVVRIRRERAPLASVAALPAMAGVLLRRLHHSGRIAPLALRVTPERI